MLSNVNGDESENPSGGVDGGKRDTPTVTLFFQFQVYFSVFQPFLLGRPKFTQKIAFLQAPYIVYIYIVYVVDDR